MSEITNSTDSTGSTVPSNGAIHDYYDPNSGDTIGYTVVTAVAAARETDPIDLPPLYDSIDVDALDAIVDGAQDRPDDVEGRVSFTYAGLEIAVDFDGWIQVDLGDDGLD